MSDNVFARAEAAKADAALAAQYETAARKVMDLAAMAFARATTPAAKSIAATDYDQASDAWRQAARDAQAARIAAERAADEAAYAADIIAIAEADEAE